MTDPYTGSSVSRNSQHPAVQRQGSLRHHPGLARSKVGLWRSFLRRRGILTKRPGFDVSRRLRNLQQLRRVNKTVCFRMLLVHWAVTWWEKLEFPTGLLKKFFCFPCGGKCRLARGSPLCNIDPETYFKILRADKQKYPIADRHDFQNHHWGW